MSIVIQPVHGRKPPVACHMRPLLEAVAVVACLEPDGTKALQKLACLVGNSMTGVASEYEQHPGQEGVSEDVITSGAVETPLQPRRRDYRIIGG